MPSWIYQTAMLVHIRRPRPFLALSLVSMIVGTGASGQVVRPKGAIDGVVTDTALAPVRDAVVSLDGVNASLMTGPNGRFRILALSPGSYELRVRKLGFAPTRSRVQLMPADTLRIAIALEPSTVVLDSVRVTAAATMGWLAEFEERRARGDGQYLTAAEIERRNSVTVLDLLIPFSGVGLQAGTRAINRRYGATRNCPFQVFIDEVKIPTPDLRNSISPRELAGIEVYTSIASVPLQYRSAGDASACGVILLWTKRGG